MRRGIDSVYIHIPFCEQFCSYCHFVKVSRALFDLEKYVTVLGKEISSRLMSEPHWLDTLYIGGGSPSLLTEYQLKVLVDAIAGQRAVTHATEFTLEANPEHVGAQRLDVWRKMGVNRLSLGVQSFNGSELRFLGRNHTAEGGAEAVKAAAAAGFNRISIDILMGLKGQSWSMLQESLMRAVDLPIDHLSLYILEKPALAEGDDERIAENYDKSCLLLKRAGLTRYEISNFARPGGQSRHNRAYWRNQKYYGFGAAASGYDGFCEYRNTASIRRYMQQISVSGEAIDRKEYPDRFQRLLVTGLRMRAGIPVSTVNVSRTIVHRLLAENLLELHLGRIRIPDCQILRTNSILSELI